MIEVKPFSREDEAAHGRHHLSSPLFIPEQALVPLTLPAA